MANPIDTEALTPVSSRQLVDEAILKFMSEPPTRERALELATFLNGLPSDKDVCREWLQGDEETRAKDVPPLAFVIYAWVEVSSSEEHHRALHQMFAKALLRVLGIG